MSSGIFSCLLNIFQIRACLLVYSSKNFKLLVVLTRRSCLLANCHFNNNTNVSMTLL